MCGIAGSITDYKISQNLEKKILASMYHRGPDDRGKAYFKFKKNLISFFHTRLSIIDLNERSVQPMTYKYATIVFNGEIYNYLELRSFLTKKGYKFNTSSDTEVLLISYIHWGEEFIKHLNGMWAFSIWDNKKKQLILSRDRFGEKPLYYYNKFNNFFFSSETKTLKLF